MFSKRFYHLFRCIRNVILHNFQHKDVGYYLKEIVFYINLILSSQCKYADVTGCERFPHHRCIRTPMQFLVCSAKSKYRKKLAIFYQFERKKINLYVQNTN